MTDPTPGETAGGVGGEATAAGLTIVRVFDAPRELVFRAWTEPARFASWFGLHDSTVPLDSVSMDLRPGGAWRATMVVGPGRTEIPWRGVYREVEPHRRLVFTLSDQPGDDQETDLVTVELSDLGGGRTEMRFSQTGGHLSAEQYARARQGWLAFFERLAGQLAA